MRPSTVTTTGALLLFLLLLSSCREGVTLHPAECVQSCFTGPERARGKGICRDGWPRCENGQLVECVGEVLPSLEVCDDVDNDCDGRTDEYSSDLRIGSACFEGIEGLSVEPPSQCLPGTTRCEKGEVVCSRVTGPSVEICDGVDNDCDGLIDNDIPPSGVCYGGDLNDLTRPRVACRAGVYACMNGVQRCVGQILPTQEICNGVDDDCDGFADNVEPEQALPADIVFIVDRSGSMIDQIAALKVAVLAFLEAGASSENRYALIDLPGRGIITASLASDFVTAEEVAPLIRNLDASHGGIEPSYDAIIQATDGTFPLSWRSGTAHVIVFFGDEHGQTRESYTEDDAKWSVARYGIYFYGFIAPGFWGDYDDIPGNRGRLFSVFATARGLSELVPILFSLGCPSR